MAAGPHGSNRQGPRWGSRREGEDGATPLHIAASHGQEEVVDDLLAKGARVDRVMKGGVTPLFIAAQHGQKEVVDVLLAKDAQVGKANKDGATPLHAAAQHGHKEVADVLLAKGALLGQPNKVRDPTVAAAGLEATKIDRREAELLNGATPLFIAAQHGQKEVVDFLLAKRALVDVANKVLSVMHALRPFYENHAYVVGDLVPAVSGSWVVFAIHHALSPYSQPAFEYPFPFREGPPLPEFIEQFVQGLVSLKVL
ncbi:hypothetical protein CYMTET_6131 [Cymbomonas tetramitiformis]|uniref:Uncharacterized protein n=1 Tax=Cymbomonas tetramitiformis TaxID=36881 RepID=A0AAE0LIQ9_9CHLO|nr:hypothetical protein CYMTET_6131 [Cymbomonas tetramitiformis]